MSLRCKLSGHDLDPCGVCKRCGDEAGAAHDWVEGERERPCFKQKSCSRCGKSQETPDHDWESRPGVVEEVELVCSRCGLKICPMGKLKSRCCFKFEKKAKACKHCPVMALYDKKERKKILSKAKKRRKAA